MPANAVKTKTIKAETIRPLLTIKADDAGVLPTRMEVLQTGMWDAPYHGQFMITPEDLQQYIQNFNANVRPSSSSQGLPIDLDHDMGAAAGWMTGLNALPNDLGGWSLWADVTWTPLGQQKLLDGEYAFFSPEFCPEGYIDPEGENDACDNVLIGGGLTNRPLFDKLQPVMASDASGKSSGLKSQFNKMYLSAKESSMPTLDEVRVKDAADITDDERQLLTEHLADLSADEKAKFGLGEDGNKKPEVPPTNTNTNKIEEPQVTANDKTENVTISANELKALKDAAARGVSADERLQRKEAEDHITSKVFNTTEGFKFASDLKGELVDLYHSADDDQRKVLDKLFDAATPIKTADQMKAQGKSEDFDPGTAHTELTKKAEEIVKASNNKTTFDQAIIQVRRDEPALAQMADESYQANKPQLVAA